MGNVTAELEHEALPEWPMQPGLVVNWDHGQVGLQTLLDLASLTRPGRRASWLSMLDSVAKVGVVLEAQAWDSLNAALGMLLLDLGYVMSMQDAVQLYAEVKDARERFTALSALTVLAHRLVVLAQT
jgi:hypothetical protein